MFLGCRMDLQNNMDFPGSDVSQVYASDAKHCQNLCSDHPTCMFFTFVRPDWTQDTRYKTSKRMKQGKFLNLRLFFCRHFYCYFKVTASGEPKIKTPKLGVTSGYSLRSCMPELTGSYKKSVFFKLTVSAVTLS